MPVSRLFTEVGQNIDRMNASLREAINAAQDADVKVTKAGQSFISAFQDALNPTQKVTEQLQLLQAAGQADSDIVTVLGDRIRAAGDQAEKSGQPMSDLFQSFRSMAQESDKSGLSIESLGKLIGDFATNPLEAAKGGIASLVESVGPLGVGLTAIGGAAVAAGGAFVSMVADLVEINKHFENLSAMTGQSVEQLEALTGIEKEAGLEGLDLGRTLGKLQQSLGDDSANSFTKAVQELGISITDSSGKTKDAVDVLDELRDALLEIEDPTERAQAAQQALGGRMRELIPLLLTSSESLRDQIKLQIDAGNTTDELSQKKLKALHEAYESGARVIEGWWHQAKLASVEMLDEIFHFSELTPAAEKNAAAHKDSINIYRDMAAANAELNAGLKDEAEADKEWIKNQTEQQKQADAAARKLEQLTNKHFEHQGSVESTVKTLSDWSRAMRDLTEKDLADLERELGKAGDAMQAMQDKLNTDTEWRFGKDWDNNMKDLMKDIPSVSVLMKSQQNLGVTSFTTLKQHTIDWRNEIVNCGRHLTADLGAAFADVLIKGGNFKKDMLNIFENLAGNLMTKMTTFFLQPLQGAIDSLLGKLGGLLTNAIPGLGGIGIPGTGGGGISIPGGLSAGGGGGAGGGVGGLGSSLLSGGLSALGGILGGVVGSLISGPTKGKEIEENTRYCKLYLNGIEQKELQIRDGLVQMQGEMHYWADSDGKLRDLIGSLGDAKHILWLIRGDTAATAASLSGLRPTGASGQTASARAAAAIGGGGAVININGPVYGWADFVEQVRQAGVDLRRRGTPLGAASY
jgi:hypothetical protein